jgi:hypothetical protein
MKKVIVADSLNFIVNNLIKILNRKNFLKLISSKPYTLLIIKIANQKIFFINI